MDLKVGSKIKYKNNPATIIWREYIVEEVGVWDDEMKYARHFAIYFEYEDRILKNGQKEGVTFRSMYPKPENLELNWFSL